MLSILTKGKYCPVAVVSNANVSKSVAVWCQSRIWYVLGELGSNSIAPMSS